MEQSQQLIKRLRLFFRISNLAFQMADEVIKSTSGIVNPNKMHELHKMALKEVEKENPDLDYVYRLIAEMEEMTTLINKQKK